MKREILFRAAYKRVVYNVEAFDFANGCVTLHNTGQDWFGCLIDDCILLQFTGLTDKNGDKIFEGDICKQGGSVDLTVKFRWGCFFLCNSDDDETTMGENATDFHEARYQYEERLKEPFSQLEIIGNIHEK